MKSLRILSPSDTSTTFLAVEFDSDRLYTAALGTLVSILQDFADPLTIHLEDMVCFVHRAKDKPNYSRCSTAAQLLLLKLKERERKAKGA